MKKTYTEKELIDFVNWHIDVHKLGEAYKLENRNLIHSFNNGFKPSDWHSPEKDNTELIRVPSEMVDIVQSFVEERKRQDEKWGIQNHDPNKWNSILMEEVGEVAKASLETAGSDDGVERLIEELIQTGAVTMAYIDYLKRREQAYENLDKVFLDDLKRVIESFEPVGEADIDEYLSRNKMKPEELEKHEQALQGDFYKHVERYSHIHPVYEPKYTSKRRSDAESLFNEIWSDLIKLHSVPPSMMSNSMNQVHVAVIARDIPDFKQWKEEKGLVAYGYETLKKFKCGNKTYHCISQAHDCISKTFHYVTGTQRATENKNHDYLLDMCMTQCIGYNK